jgi:hypothetical protein
MQISPPLKNALEIPLIALEIPLIAVRISCLYKNGSTSMSQQYCYLAFET